jgi:hypothetical protein
VHVHLDPPLDGCSPNVGNFLIAKLQTMTPTGKLYLVHSSRSCSNMLAIDDFFEEIDFH